MEFFNIKIDKAVRKVKTKLALEFDVTEEQIDKIIDNNLNQVDVGSSYSPYYSRIQKLKQFNLKKRFKNIQRCSHRFIKNSL